MPETLFKELSASTYFLVLKYYLPLIVPNRISIRRTAQDLIITTSRVL